MNARATYARILLMAGMVHLMWICPAHAASSRPTPPQKVVQKAPAPQARPAARQAIPARFVGRWVFFNGGTNALEKDEALTITPDRVQWEKKGVSEPAKRIPASVISLKKNGTLGFKVMGSFEHAYSSVETVTGSDGTTTSHPVQAMPVSLRREGETLVLMLESTELGMAGVSTGMMTPEVELTFHRAKPEAKGSN